MLERTRREHQPAPLPAKNRDRRHRTRSSRHLLKVDEQRPTRPSDSRNGQLTGRHAGSLLRRPPRAAKRAAASAPRLYAQHAPKTFDARARHLLLARREISIPPIGASGIIICRSDVTSCRSRGPRRNVATPFIRCWRWTQTRDMVMEEHALLAGSGRAVTASPMKRTLLVQTEGYTPVIDRQLFSQVDERGRRRDSHQGTSWI